MADTKPKTPEDLEAPSPMDHVPSQLGEVLKGDQTHHDAVFGEITEGGPNYRNVSAHKI